MTADPPTFQGALQATIMRTLWEHGGGTVQEVRAALPAHDRQAYTTIQTVLNRLVDRGLVERERRGVAFSYRPAVAESEYVSRSIGRVLDGASPDARQAALTQLVGALREDDLETLGRLAAKVDDWRRGQPLR
jgi:predicted transcriptional regulator